MGRDTLLGGHGYDWGRIDRPDDRLYSVERL